MKELISKEIGGDGAKVSLAVDENALMVNVSYPLDKILSPVNKVVDDLMDKLEKLIPGDQTAMAEAAKKDAHEALAKLLSSQLGS